MKYRVFVLSVLASVSYATFAQKTQVKPSAQPAPTPSPTPAAKPAIPLKQIPASSFAKLPYIENAEISPNGKMIAGLFGVDGRQVIGAFLLDGNKSTVAKLSVPDSMQVTGILWVNDDNIILSVTSIIRVYGYDMNVGRLLAVHLPTKKITQLFKESKGSMADVVWTPTDGSHEILVSADDSIYSDDPDAYWPSVYKIDVTTGQKKTVLKSKAGVSSWSADRAGNVRAGIAYDGMRLTSRLLYRSEANRDFSVVERAKLMAEENLRVPFMYIPGTDNGYVIHDSEKGFSGIYEINLLTGAAVQTIYEPQNSDVERVITSSDGTKLLGVTTSTSNGVVIWFTPEMKAMQAKLDESIKGAKALLYSLNGDHSKMILKMASPDIPGDLFYFNHKESTIDKISSINPVLGSKRLSPVKMIQYKARDGLGIEGVLTLPKGVTPKNLPFIVMPHGGPWGQDTLRYDYWAQFVASRGYAVLQPNFRGSTGYGTEFVNKGKGQMGFAMQDDVTDGVKWAVEQGIADPKRVCIVGASYGGYAAMWGIVKDPDLYRCAISISGVSLLRKEVNNFGTVGLGKLYTRQWKELTPDFNAVSPARFTDKIKAPLLLIHGKKDVTVDHVQSEKMNSAMKKSGKSVEFVSIPLADHYFTREEDRITLLTKMEAFLAKHNPAD
jgi:dipeptidyl aminopeptidase/acylaminoacyl peptidase